MKNFTSVPKSERGEEMRKVVQYEGCRIRIGYHTGYAVFEKNGKYYISTESGTRKATKREIATFKRTDSK